MHLPGSKMCAISWMKAHLAKSFEIDDPGEARDCLGLRVSLTSPERKLWLNQSKYSTDLLTCFQMSDMFPLYTPMQEGKFLESKLITEHVIGFIQPRYLCREAIGSLIYFMIRARADLAFAVGKLAHFCESPNPVHCDAVKRVFQYVNGTCDTRIGNSGAGRVDIRGFLEYDWADDSSHQKSTSEYLSMIARKSISW